MSKNTYKLWTITAKQCYLIGANCQKRNIIPDDIKKKCRMKEAIISLTKEFGKPFERKNNIVYCTPCKRKKNSVK